MSSPVDDVISCHAGSIDTSWLPKTPDDPGIKNFVRGTLAASLQPLFFLKKEVVDIFKPSSAQDIARNAASYIDKANKIVSGEALKQVIEETIKSTGIKIPNPTELAKQTLPDANIDLSSISGMSDIMVGIFQEVVSGKVIAKDAVDKAINDIKAKVETAAGSQASRVSWVVEWYGQMVKFLTFILAIPMFIIKLIIDFVKKIITETVSTLTKIMTEGPAYVITFIKEQLSDLVNGALDSLGLKVSIPGVTTPPIIQMTSCVLKSVKTMIEGFPGNLSGLQKDLAVS